MAQNGGFAKRFFTPKQKDTQMIDKKTIIILLAVCLCGLSWAPDSASAGSGQAANLKLPATPEEGYAMVYMVRPSEVDLFSKFYVYLDEKSGESRIGYTRGMEYLYFPVTPGKHRIFSQGRNTKGIDISAEEGEVIFIKQPVKLDIDGTNVDNMEILDPETGAYIVNHTTMGTLDKH